MSDPDASLFPPTDSDGNETSSIHLWDYVHIVLQRLPLAIAVFLTCITLSTIYAWTRTPRYTASARLLIQPGAVNLTDMKGAFDPAAAIGMRDFMETQVRLVSSRPVLAATLDKAGLASDPQFAQSRDPIVALQRVVSVSPVRGTTLIDISAERENPRQAQRIVNTLLDAFLADSQARRLGVSEEGLEELRAKAETLREKLDAASRQRQEFMVQNKMVSFERTQNVILEKLRDLSRKLTEVEPRRMALQARVTAAEEAIAKGKSVDALPDVIASPIVKTLKLQLADLERDYAQLLQRLGANHPQIQAVSTQMDAVNTKIGMEAAALLASIQTEYEQARKEETLLRQAIGEQETAVFHFNEVAGQYSVIEQSFSSVENAYQTIMRRIEEIDINRMSGQGNNTFVVARADEPRVPSWPNKLRIILLALFLSAGLAVGLCFFLDYMDTTVKTEADARHFLGAPVMASIPDARTESDEEGADLVLQRNPKSHAAEAFRTLRTAMAFSVPGEPLRRIVVTSVFPEEGKSMVSINLAIAHAQTGRKTLLVDTDMRKPRVHKALAVASSKGIANLLAGDEELHLRDVVVQTNVPGLYFLPCGPIPPRPVEMLDSRRFETLLDEIDREYDFAVFDSPPSLTLIDSWVMARKLGGMLMVLRSFVTPKRPLQHLSTRLRAAGVPLIGIVLNNVDQPKGGYYYGSYYYYGRKRYYYYEDQRDDTTPPTSWRERIGFGRRGDRRAAVPSAAPKP